MQTIHIPLGAQIEAADRLIDDMKTVSGMLEGDSKAQEKTIFDMNCLIAIRETLKSIYVPGKDDGEPIVVGVGPTIYGRDKFFPRRVSAEVLYQNGIVPRPSKHR